MHAQFPRRAALVAFILLEDCENKTLFEFPYTFRIKNVAAVHLQNECFQLIFHDAVLSLPGICALHRCLFRPGSGGASELLWSLMNQSKSLIETSAQIRRRQPNRSPSHDQKVGCQLRILQQLGSRLECRHTHQDDCHHQAAPEQSQYSAEETVKTAETGFFHDPARDPGGDAEQEHDGKKDDKKTQNLSQPRVL